MKKWIFMLALVMAFACVACSGGAGSSNNDSLSNGTLSESTGLPSGDSDSSTPDDGESSVDSSTPDDSESSTDSSTSSEDEVDDDDYVYPGPY